MKQTIKRCLNCNCEFVQVGFEDKCSLKCVQEYNDPEFQEQRFIKAWDALMVKAGIKC